MRNTTPLLRYLIFGSLRRDFILPVEGRPALDVLGGSLPYAAAGLRLWDHDIGAVARVNPAYPREWLNQLENRGVDVRGVNIIDEVSDLRSFYAYPDAGTCQTENPIGEFLRVGLPLPPELLGFQAPPPALDSRKTPSPLTLRMNDLPDDYLDASAAHLCPLDYLSHALLPAVLRQGQISTITLDPAPGYMNPTYWDDLPVLLRGITAVLCSEEKMLSLFEGRTEKIWEMAEGLAQFGPEIVVIKRGPRGQCLYECATGKRWELPAYPARVVDPTGAGDAFCGGFLAGYRMTYEPLEAALYGSVAASFCIEGSGPFYLLDAMPALVEARKEAIRAQIRRV